MTVSHFYFSWVILSVLGTSAMPYFIYYHDTLKKKKKQSNFFLDQALFSELQIIYSAVWVTSSLVCVSQESKFKIRLLHYVPFSWSIFQAYLRSILFSPHPLSLHQWKLYHLTWCYLKRLLITFLYPCLTFSNLFYIRQTTLPFENESLIVWSSA